MLAASIELEVKDNTETVRSASYLNLHLKHDSEDELSTKISDKRHDFNLPIVNLPFIYNNSRIYLNINHCLLSYTWMTYSGAPESSLVFKVLVLLQLYFSLNYCV